MNGKDVIPDKLIGATETPVRTEGPAELISDTRPVVATVTAESAVLAENPGLALYRQQYDRLPDDIKARCGWEDAIARLLANGGEKLKLASAMQGGGQLVGIGTEGKALFKDKGVEPVLFGYDKEKRLLKIYDRDPEQMKLVVYWADYHEVREQVLKDGYELFVDNGYYGFGNEMKQVEAHTKEPFVASANRDVWRVSWLESGDKPVNARCAYFNPVGCRVGVTGITPAGNGDGYGAVRRLRV